MKSLSIAIATYERGEVLLETVRALLAMPVKADELIVIDQTPAPPVAVADQLRAWDAAGDIRWLRLDRPSVPHAMNAGLQEARSEIVLFVDDDVVPSATLVSGHRAAYAAAGNVWGVVGQVLQPGEEPLPVSSAAEPSGFRRDLSFRFCSTQPRSVANVIGCNMSVLRSCALQVGGFDENFSGAAYRFETEFCRRLLGAGGEVRFEPQASLRHLRATRGGTRAGGGHMASASPRHGMGDYYFALQSGLTLESTAYMLVRPFREVRTRFHLRHPWYIPVKLVGEVRAFAAAVEAYRRGPRLLPSRPGAAAASVGSCEPVT